MPAYRQDRRTPADNDWGKPQVNYPTGLPNFPEIIETGTYRQSKPLPAALSSHPDTINFPTGRLTGIRTDVGGNTDVDWWLTYTSLPGPIFVDVRAYRDTGIPMLTARQQVASDTSYVSGEFQPTPVNVSSITDNGNGTCTVTLSTAHDLPPKCWVAFSGTNSTPAIDGNQEIISVPSPTQVIIAATLTGAGTAAGMMTAVNRIVRELQPVPGNANILVKIDTMVAVPSAPSNATAITILSIQDNGSGTALVTTTTAHGLSVGDWTMIAGNTGTEPTANGPRKVLSVGSSTTFTIELTLISPGSGGTSTPMGPLAGYNEDFHCWKDFDFPDFLTAINFYNNAASTSGYNGYNYSISWGGAVGLPMQDGYRGPCRARRLRCFFVGPPPSSFESNLAPTFIMPSSGTFVIKGGSESKIFTPDLLNDTISEAVNYRTGRIPHCLTGPSPSGIGGVGGGTYQASLELNLPQSVPAKFTVGDIITMMGQPQKYDAGALWEVIVYLIVVPYTSGMAPP